MSIEWVLVWVLVTTGTFKVPATYSQPMKTLEDCERMRSAASPKGGETKSTCIEVHILVPKAKP